MTTGPAPRGDGLTALELGAICIARARSDVRGPWLRAAPIVLRQALEDAVTEALDGVGVDRAASMRAKLLCLSQLAGADAAHEARALWARLSGGCHYSAYQLDPTLDDLDDWSARTSALCARLTTTDGSH